LSNVRNLYHLRSPSDHYTSTKNACGAIYTLASGLRDDSPKSVNSGSNRLDDDGVIIRSTNLPAPLNAGTGEPTMRGTSAATQNTVTRSTCVSTLSSGSTALRSAKPAVAEHSRETIIQSTTPQCGSSHGGTTMLGSRAISVIPEVIPSATHHVGTFGFSGNSTQSKPFFVPSPHATPSNFSQIHKSSSYFTPTLLEAQVLQNPSIGVVCNEDIEMSCSDVYSPPEIFRSVSRGSFQGINNQNVRSLCFNLRYYPTHTHYSFQWVNRPRRLRQ
jgi:hypothetical protein